MIHAIISKHSSPSLYIVQMMRRVVVTRGFPQEFLNALRSPQTMVAFLGDEGVDDTTRLEDFVGKDGGADAIVCTLSDPITKSVMDAAGSKLKVVSTYSVGYNHIDVQTALSKHIRVGYTPDVLSEATADLIMALTLATCRRLEEAINAVKSGTWGAWSPYWMCGYDLYGKSVGIIGMGRIGSAVARRLRGFNCNIRYYGRSGPKPALEEQLGATFLPLDDLLQTSDVIIVICALTPDTRHLINAARLNQMKPNAVFINASRGEVVNQDALVDALRQRPNFRAGLDVCTPEPLPADSPLLSLPNVTVLPHIGSASIECRSKMLDITLKNTLCALNNEPMPGEVPETAAKFLADKRQIC